jgi:cobalamin biosynthesis protein CobW
VQAVGARVRHQFDKPWGANRRGQLVVIAEHDHVDLAAIKSVLGA